MRRKTLGLAATSLAAFGAFALTGAAIANAADGSTPTASPSASASVSTGDRAGGGPGGRSQDTAVTGAEADKVIAAVKAKDSSAAIDAVRKDPDGSYDALGTKDGHRVFYDVSADLKTITENAGGPGGPGGTSSGGTTSTDRSGANASITSNAI
jgi:hypothetical protein